METIIKWWLYLISILSMLTTMLFTIPSDFNNAGWSVNWSYYAFFSPAIIFYVVGLYYYLFINGDKKK